ncbi:MAG: hypothetical protein CMJ25_17875 [Phycisphaerae bacterium]|nr:hypothetical protein [Phycisphaerae bacterium]
MAKIKPLRPIFDIPLKTMKDIADASVNIARTTVRRRNTFGTRRYNKSYAEYKKELGRSSRNTKFIDLTFSGNTLNSYKTKEARKNQAIAGFTNEASEKIAKDLSSRGLDFLNATVVKAIQKEVSDRADKQIKLNLEQTSQRVRIEI